MAEMAVHTHIFGRAGCPYTRTGCDGRPYTKTLLACADPKREAAAALASSLMTQ